MSLTVQLIQLDKRILMAVLIWKEINSAQTMAEQIWMEMHSVQTMAEQI